jgi:hypothetical protein
MSRGSVAIASLPAEYKPSDMDNAGDPEYYGFINAGGGWYIMRIAGGTEFRYCTGYGGYAGNWTGRVGLTYGYLNDVF